MSEAVPPIGTTVPKLAVAEAATLAVSAAIAIGIRNPL
jgi:hypothetical protein